MAIHFNLIDTLKGYCSTTADTLPLTFFTQIILHTADLSNFTRQVSNLHAWVDLLRKEFQHQYANEIKLNLPTLSHMKECSPIEKFKSEIGYISGIVLPLWTVLVDLFPGLQLTLDQINSNIQSYQKEIDNVPETVAA